MTDQAPPVENPSAKSSGSLLEPEEKGAKDFILPGILGLAGAALLYNSFSKSEKKKSSAKPEAKDNEVKFSKSYSSFAVGKDWESMTLEPYLAEQAEEGNLITEDYAEDSAIDSKGSIEPMVKDTRRRILSAFMATHKVSTADGDTLISKLPDKPGVRQFKDWLDAQTKKFQEEY